MYSHVVFNATTGLFSTTHYVHDRKDDDEKGLQRAIPTVCCATPFDTKGGDRAGDGGDHHQ